MSEGRTEPAIESGDSLCYLFFMKLKELPQIMALSTAEKLELIDDLWISIEPELQQIEVSEQEKKLLDDRWEKFSANPESALTLKQLKAAVASRLK